MANESFKKIEEFIKSKPVVLYMKGTADFPQCGFSARAVQVLKAAGVNREQMATFDVLEDEEIRNAIKEFSNWPTIPQCYINGQFVGGSDVLMEMHETGELKDLLGGN